MRPHGGRGAVATDHQKGETKMRTQEQTVYQFGELTDDAKERARQWFRDGDWDNFTNEAEWFASPDGWGLEPNGRHGAWWTTPWDRAGADMMIAPDDGGTIAPPRGITVLENYAAYRLAVDWLGVTFHWRHRSASRSMCDGEIAPVIAPEWDPIGLALDALDPTLQDDLLGEPGAEWDPTDAEMTRQQAETCPDGAWAIAWEAAEHLQAAINDAWERTIDWVTSDEYIDDAIMANEYEFDEDGRLQTTRHVGR